MSTVWLGTKSIVGPLAHHWAVRLGGSAKNSNGSWYELDGATKSQKKAGGRNTINGGYPGDAHYSDESRIGATCSKIVGKTKKSSEEIKQYNTTWLKKHPTYNVSICNCQMYVYDFVEWLTNGSHDLPQMQSSLSAYANGPSSFSTTGVSYASVGKASAQASVLGVEARGPSCGASCNNGLYANASVGAAEVKVAGVSARFEPNVNTGIGQRQDGNYGVSVVGFGVGAGENGLSIDTPVGGVTCSLM